MAGLKLDGAGQAKLKTLEDALVILQRIHALVEQYALGVKRQTPTGAFMMNLKRQLPALGGLLKGQFGMISDQIAAVTLAITRGSSEPTRIRQMREGVAQISTSIELAQKQVLQKHTISE
ncbi:MAG: hypothetical protein KGL93_07685 [Gemmatimonadota bacterium]|nr:hypothetical protein [Gemmatimonadota bacterium]HEU4990505.1 hypothetical protein [Gemmatimonadaceae bacterium]